MYQTAPILDPRDGISKSFSIPIVQELAKQSLNIIPERYVKPEQERPSIESVVTAQDLGHGIPIVDFGMIINDTNADARNVEMKKLAEACEEWGFFHIINHGIANEMMDNMQSVVKEFFALPTEEKLKCSVKTGDGYGMAFVSSDEQKLDWLDALTLFTQPPYLRDMQVWPLEPSGFRETLEDYSAAVEDLTKKVLRALAENLGLLEDQLVHAFGNAEQRVRMNYYPPCPMPELVCAQSAHSDASGLTILLQPVQPVGLHVRKGDRWVAVEPMEGSLVVNIGDMVEVMTNGRYKSIEHRAVANVSMERVSIAAFARPCRDMDVGPAPQLIDGDHPRLYKNFVSKDYFKNFFKSKLSGKKVIDAVKV